MPPSMMEKLQMLLKEEEMPKPVYKPGLSEHELKDQAPDLSRPPLSLSHPHEIEHSNASSPAIHANSNIRIRGPGNLASEGSIDSGQRDDTMAPANSNKKTFSSKENPAAVTSGAIAIQGVHGNDERPGARYVADPDLGKLADPNEAFSPVAAIAKYPYKFVHKRFQEPIAQKFFTDSQFWYREWDIWYIWPDLPNTTKPILLIPSKQVETLLKDINNAVDDAHLILGTEAEEIGLVIRFPNHPDLLPRYLGHSTCREQFVRLERHVPNAVRRRKGEIPHKDAPNNRTAQEWRRQMEMAFDVAKGKSRASKNTRKEQRAEKQQAWKGSLRKAERALGLRPALLRENEPAANAPWSEIKAFHNHRDQAYHDCKHPPPANPMEPPRWPFEDSPVFISVDIECYEHNKGQITEIGLATLDTNDLEGIAPSDKGQGWHPKIRPRHFRIREHAHLFNSDYVSGCADRFEFGESEMIALADVPAKIAECFRHPFSAKSSASTAASQSAHDSGAQDPRAKSTSLDSSNGPSSSDFSNTLINLPLGPSQTATTPNKPIPRKIILLGHDLSQDIRYLLRLGYQPLNNPHVTTLDTSELHRALIREWQPKSLAGILYDFELLAWNLHNGGNDAVYTLWIMLAICVKSAKERGDVEVKREREEKRKSAVEEAARKEVERVWEEGCGWSDDGDQEEEGGVSVSSGNGVW